MKVYFVDNPEQNENTINPQLFDGEIKYWKTNPTLSRGRTLAEHIKLYKEYKPYITELYIYDVKGFCGVSCDQCKMGSETGCYSVFRGDLRNPELYRIIIDSYEVRDEEIRKEFLSK